MILILALNLAKILEESLRSSVLLHKLEIFHYLSHKIELSYLDIVSVDLFTYFITIYLIIN